MLGTSEGIKIRKKNPTLCSQATEKCQGESGQGKSKASHQMGLGKELAKSLVPNWDMIVTVLLVKAGPTIRLMTESFLSMRTNEKACWRSSF